MAPGKFLTAEWQDLVMLNYALEPSLLQPYVPAGTELDSFDGKTYASLVGFKFNRTRIAGIAIPFHRSFEEVNLRFYVRRGSKRGVVFISELVPKFAVAAIARYAFGEKYSSVPMSHLVHTRTEDNVLEAEYFWGSAAHRCSIWIETAQPAFVPVDDSLSQFITEHYWGYASQKDGSCLEYEVQHPRWLVREADNFGLSGDAGRYYGSEFAAALRQPAQSAFIAEGSAISVFKGIRI
jgi:uncharacterized protein